MRTIRILLAIAAGGFWSSTLICGLWLRYAAPRPLDPGSIAFHMTCGIVSVVLGFVLVILSFTGRPLRAASRASAGRVAS